MSAAPKTYKIAFFGTPDRAVWALEELERAGIVPALVVTQPDRPQGRKMIVSPPPAKVWAESRGIPVLQPEKLSDPAFLGALRDGSFDAFVVVAYGKILKKELLDIPRRGCLNLHASLLPRLRGASPIETAILRNEKETGATVMLMDELMDHGPILAQEKVSLPVWPIPAEELARKVVAVGGRLMAACLPQWIEGKIEAKEQDHSKATVAGKIAKEDGLIDLSADPYQNFLKWNAYKEWPKSYFFVHKDGKQARVIVSDAAYENGAFVIRKVVPEGRKEISWQEFERGLR